MPDVTMPNGDVVNFPDDMPKEQIKGMIASKFPEETAALTPQPSRTLGQNAGDFWEGIKAGAVPFSDEIQAGVAAYSSAPFVEDLTLGQAYDQALTDFRGQQKQAEQNPMAYYPGMATGAIVTGIESAKSLGKELPNVARFIARNPIIGTAGTGLVSGSIYGFGAGEGSGAERLKQAGMAGGAGMLAGPVGAIAGQRVLGPLAQKAARLFKKSPAPSMAGKTVQDIAASSDNLPVVAPTFQASDAEAKALSKVQQAIKKDFPDNYDQVLEAWKGGDSSLADLYGSQTRTLAQGAAQYPSGKAVAQKYFDAETLSSPERFKSAIAENIAGSDNYFATVDDVISAGQAKAKPFYEKAYKAEIPMPSEGFAPEVQGAINAAKRKDPSELKGLPDNSVKVLDYAKRVLDDNINTAQRAGQGNFVRNRTGIKNELLAQMDQASPDYAMARAKSGDYLSAAKAMDDGRDFMKLDPELIGKRLKEMSDTEKTSFKIGVSKQLSDIVEKRGEGMNPYNAVMGSSEQKNRLMKILSPTEYKNLERNLKAEDRLFKMRNEVLGNSTTVGKSIAAAQIAEGGADALMALSSGGSVKSAGLDVVRGALRKAFDGLNDKTAEQVAQIIFETNPDKKLQILQKIAGSKALTKTEKQIVKDAYFKAENVISPRIAGGVAGGSGASMLMDGNKNELRITVTPKDKK